MATAGIDALVLHGPENIYYLSGYQTPGYYFYLALDRAGGRGIRS